METNKKREIIQLSLVLKVLRDTPLGNQLGLMNRLFAQSLAPHGVCWAVTATGHTWKVDLSDSCHRWMIYGDYADPGFLAWARATVASEGTIVDSGSNIGQFLPYFSEIVASGKILAFEPSSYCADWIRECLQANADMPVELLQKGLGDKKGEFSLTSGKEAHGLWGKVDQDQGSGLPGETIHVTTLSSIIEEKNIDYVDLWKLDVEGFELQALKGATPLLSDQRIKALYVELSSSSRKEDVEYLDQFGYVPYKVERGGTLNPIQSHPDEEINALFLLK